METKRLFRKAMIICLLTLFTCPSWARTYHENELTSYFTIVSPFIISNYCEYGEWGFQAYFNRSDFAFYDEEATYGMLISFDEGKTFEDYGIATSYSNSIDFDDLYIDYIQQDGYYTIPDGSDLDNPVLMDCPVLFTYNLWINVPKVTLYFYYVPSNP